MTRSTPFLKAQTRPGEDIKNKLFLHHVRSFDRSSIEGQLTGYFTMSDSEYTEEEEEEFRDDMRVFLRLRPINKLEQSRRSKNCIELHEDPTLVTVDSPLEGEYDYTFDHVSLGNRRAIESCLVRQYVSYCKTSITIYANSELSSHPFQH